MEGDPASTETDASPSTDSNDPGDRTTIDAGRNFEAEFRLDASDAGAFLIELGEQLRDSEDLRIETEDWALPFAFGEPLELEVEYEGVDEPELEVELEVPGRTNDDAPAVE